MKRFEERNWPGWDSSLLSVKYFACATPLLLLFWCVVVVVVVVVCVFCNFFCIFVVFVNLFVCFFVFFVIE